MGFELATSADRAAKAADLAWRNVERIDEAVGIASELEKMISSLEVSVSSSGPGDMPTDLVYSSQSSSVLTRKRSIAKSPRSHIEVGAKATRTVTCDPVSGKAKYTWSDAQDHWIGWYGLTVGWLEGEKTSVSYPGGRLKVTYPADIVVPAGPLSLRQRKAGGQVGPADG